MVDVAVDTNTAYTHDLGDACQYPVHRAVQLNQADLLQRLLAEGECVNTGTFDSVTPLHDACLAGNLACVHILLRAGASVNARNIDGATPLCDAANNGNTECVRLLLDHGAEVNPELSLTTPIHEAVMRDKWDVINVLISAEANLNANDMHYGTPIHVAAHKNYVTAARLLLCAGANVNAAKMHQTPLHIASHNNNVAMVALLLDHGADIHARNNWGKTGHDLAPRGSETAALLLHWQKNAPSLMHMSRLVIRRALGPDRLRRLPELGLPPPAIAFLQYTDWRPLSDTWMDACHTYIACL